MFTTLEVLGGISFAGGALNLVLAAGVLASRFRARVHLFLALVLICLAVLQISALLLATNKFFDWAPLNYTYLPFLFWLGPGLFLFFFRALAPGYPLRWYHQLGFFPGGLVLLAWVLLVFVHPPAFTRLPSEFFQTGERGWAENLMVFGFSHNLVYLVAVGVKARGARVVSLAWRDRGLASVLFLLVLLFSCAIAATALSGYLLASLDLLVGSGAAIAWLVAAAYVTAQRDPEFFQKLEVVLRQAGYKNSQISNMDTGGVVRRLRELMEKEELFRDEALSLAKLAARLEISRHQLSEVLNKVLGVNFARFVNEYRVAAARAVLSREPEASILSIAYQVGFQSKSTFNAAFQRLEGCSPSQFRARNR